MPTRRKTIACFAQERREIFTVYQSCCIEGAAHSVLPLPNSRIPSPPFPPLSPSESVSLHQRRAVATRSSQKFLPKSIRISALCRTLHSPMHSWLISILLSRNRLRSLPGEAHVRNFHFCKFLTVLVVSYLFSFSIFIFCFSDVRKKNRLTSEQNSVFISIFCFSDFRTKFQQI